MRIRWIAVVALFAFCAALHAETLQDFLSAHGIPTASLSSSELKQVIVSGVSAETAALTVAAWSLPGSAVGTWPLHLIRMDRQSGATTAGQIQLSADDVCAGALLDFRVVGDFTLIGTHISPSAGCILVVDASLRLRHTLYGFGAEEVEPGRIVLTEDMVHFAAVHPERLQLADLATGKTTELYPPGDDALRAQLARRNAASMPPPEACASMNDPCRADLFDESIGPLATDRRGRFAMVVEQEAQHRVVNGEPPKATAQQWVLYIYQHRGPSWTWCESPLTDVEGRALWNRHSSFSLDDVAGRCEPTRPLVPDLRTGEMNPFMKGR